MDDKTQFVRMLDVFVLGPYLLFVAMHAKTPTYFRIGLGLIGYATMVYNARNFARNDASFQLINAIGRFPLPDV